MIDFIIANIEAVGTLIVALVVLIYAIFTKQWGAVRTAALSLMLSAERLMATAEGKEKMEQVFVEVWYYMPGWMKKFITEEKLEIKLQEWYELAKNSLYLIE